MCKRGGASGRPFLSLSLPSFPSSLGSHVFLPEDLGATFLLECGSVTSGESFIRASRTVVPSNPPSAIALCLSRTAHPIQPELSQWRPSGICVGRTLVCFAPLLCCRESLLTSLSFRAVVPYQEPKAKGDSTELSSTLSSTLPMAAMLTRNKFIGWYGAFPVHPQRDG